MLKHSTTKNLRQRKTVRARGLLDTVQKKASEDLSVSIKALVRKFDMNRRTTSRILHEYLRYTSYAIKVRRMLSEDNKSKALIGVAWFSVPLREAQQVIIDFFLTRKYSLSMQKSMGKRSPVCLRFGGCAYYG